MMDLRFVLGVDPGYANCGLAMLAQNGQHWHARNVTTVKTAQGSPLHERLRAVSRAIHGVILDVRLDVRQETLESLLIVCEAQDRAVAGHRERGTTDANVMRVQQAVGVIRAESYLWLGATFIEVEPQEAKIAVLGKGGGSADKARVERAVRALVLDCPNRMTEHATDACAIAIAGARKAHVDALRVRRTA